MPAWTLATNVTANTAGFKKGMGSARKEMSKTQKATSALKGAFGALGLALGLAGLVGAFRSVVGAASDMQETMNKFNVVFDGQTKQMIGNADQISDAFGRSKNEVRTFLASAQDLFVPLGFASDNAAKLSQQVTKLAFDLASFNNMRSADTFRDLSAALTGSGEVMKKYGVIVSEAAVKQELLRQGLNPKEATNQQKVFARLNIIMAGTTAAQGDVARSSGSLVDQQNKLKAAFEDVKVSIGRDLVPSMQALLSVLSRIIEGIKVAQRLVAGELDLSGRASTKFTPADLERISSTETGRKDLTARRDRLIREGEESKRSFSPFVQSDRNAEIKELNAILKASEEAARKQDQLREIANQQLQVMQDIRDQRPVQVNLPS